MPTGARPTHLLLLLFAAGASPLSAQITNVPRPERGVSITPFGTWSGVRTEDDGDRKTHRL
jgi:hypothetical protein